MGAEYVGLVNLIKESGLYLENHGDPQNYFRQNMMSILKSQYFEMNLLSVVRRGASGQEELFHGGPLESRF